MKIRENIDYLDFLYVAGNCKGWVHYETDNGDILNLKSALCEYIFMSLADTDYFVKNGKIVCEVEEDYVTLSPFLKD